MPEAHAFVLETSGYVPCALNTRDRSVAVLDKSKAMVGALDVTRMHAGSNRVESHLARVLDDAPVKRENSNVFETLRAEFLKHSLPVYGELYQGVVMYAVERY